jgi:uncharacterized membrane protein SpoIIM required for sporulation
MEILKSGSVDAIRTAFFILAGVWAVSFIGILIQFWVDGHKIEKLRKEFEASRNELKMEIEKLKTKTGL